MTQMIPAERIENAILLIRGHKVLIDSELADLYGEEEHEILRTHFATSSRKHGGRRYLPYAFTEHGVLMTANVLNSSRAIDVSVLIVRSFVKLRQILASHTELTRKLTDLENRLGTHDKAIRSLFTTIRQLMAPSPSSGRKIGFRTG